jgi:hypothetical protein
VYSSPEIFRLFLNSGSGEGDGDGKVESGSASLPEPIALETEEQTLEREQNERDVLDAVGHYSVPPECLARMCLRL